MNLDATPKTARRIRSYAVFISYSHAAERVLAPRLQAALQRFAVPWYHWRGRSVFRDDTSLEMTPELWPTIQRALDASQNFVLMASQESAASTWVQDELRYWLSLKKAKPIIVWTSGELAWDTQAEALRGEGDFDWTKTTALPDVLRGIYKTPPLYLDLTWAHEESRVTLRDPRFRTGVAKLVAGIDGKALEDIIGRDLKYRRLLFAAGLTLVMILASLAAIAGWQWWVATERADYNYQMRYVSTLSLAQTKFAGDDLPRGLQLLDEFLPSNRSASERDPRNFYWYYLWRKHHQEFRTLHGHTDEIAALTFSRDGRLLASGDNAGIVKLWDVKTQTLRATLPPHELPVSSLAFSPDGALIASSSNDETVRVWRISKAQEDMVLRGDTGYVVSCVAFSPDGSQLAFSSKDIHLWDLSTRRELPSLHNDTQNQIQLNYLPDGRLLGTIRSDNSFRVWDVRTGATVISKQGRAGSMGDTNTSDDGRWFVYYLLESGISVWNLDQGKHVSTIDAPLPLSGCLGVSDSGHWSGVGGRNGTLTLWDISSKRQSPPIGGHEGFVTRIAFSPDDALIATGSDDHTVRLWDPKRAGDAEVLRPEEDWITSIAISPDGRLVASTGDGNGSVRLWDAASAVQLGVIAGLSNRAANSVSFSANGHLLAIGGPGSQVRLCDVANRKDVHTFDSKVQDVLCTAFSPDGRLLAIGGYNTNVEVRDVRSSKILHILSGNRDVVYSLSISRDNDTIACSGPGDVIHLWSLHCGRRIATMAGHKAEVLGLRFSHNGRLLASGDLDGIIKIWDVASRRELATLRGHTGPGNCVAFSPDDSVLASGSEDQTVRLWDVRTAQELSVIPRGPDGHNPVEFSRTGRLMIVGGSKGITFYYGASDWDVAVQSTVGLKK